MEDLDIYMKDAKMYKLRLRPRDILVVAIPSSWYKRASALEKVQNLTRDVEEHFTQYGYTNPILVLPDDMNIFKLEVKSLSKMEEIDPELEGFENDFKI